MKLHEFLTDHRDELIAHAIDHLKKRTPRRRREELAFGIASFLDELIRALRHATGEPDITSSLPGRSVVAMEIARHRLRSGFPPAELAMAFGSVSMALGSLGRQRGTSFSSHEYGVFNESIDTSVATAIETYTTESAATQSFQATERLGFLAHELRNALSSAEMAFTMLRENNLPVRGRTGDVLARAHERMKQLIERALFTARMEAGVRPPLRELNVADLLRDLEVAVPKRAEVSLSIVADETLEAMGDDGLLTSAISNLVQNAMKFTHRGGRVQVRAQREGAYAAIEVEDECGGLPPGDPHELFESFVRRSARAGGVGLGLAITRDAVLLQGGTIAVRDVPGKGCVFTIRLTLPPRAPSDA